jgi:cell division protein FtsB
MNNYKQEETMHIINTLLRFSRRTSGELRKALEDGAQRLSAVEAKLFEAYSKEKLLVESLDATSARCDDLERENEQLRQSMDKLKNGNKKYYPYRDVIQEFMRSDDPVKVIPLEDRRRQGAKYQNYWPDLAVMRKTCKKLHAKIDVIQRTSGKSNVAEYMLLIKAEGTGTKA